MKRGYLGEKMKKIIISCLMLLLVLPFTSIFAEDTADSSYFQLNMILSNSKTLSSAQSLQVSNLASNLSAMQRMMLLETNKKSTTGPFVLNLVLGLGIGSYVQGDIVGGNIGLLGELLSYAFLLGGYQSALNAAMESTYDPYSGTYYSEEDNAGLGLIAIGSIGLFATRLFELIRPFSFASDYNKKLSNSLMSFSMVPVIDQNNDMKMLLATNIKF